MQAVTKASLTILYSNSDDMSWWPLMVISISSDLLVITNKASITVYVFSVCDLRSQVSLWG